MGGNAFALPPDFLEMRSADKITLVNTVYGTNPDTLSTACTKRVIYCCQIIYHLDRSVRAGLFTLHTSDTAV